MTFRHNFEYTVNSFVVSVNAIVMINICLMHEEILKTINMYWFLNNASERNNPLNGNSNEPQINE